MTRYGFQEQQWEVGKSEMFEIVKGVAKLKGTITYGDLAQKLTTIKLQPHDYAMHVMLGEISGEEDKNGRGMLSAVVVNKETGKPGKGFFQYASELRRDVRDEETFWIQEISQVYDSWDPK